MELPEAFTEQGDINVVIETSKGSRHKYTFEPRLQLFKLSKILPAGTVFPLNFGFIPGTRADDGDPVDVLVMSDAICMGVLLECRIAGVIKVKQKEKGTKWVRNDRIMAIPIASHDYNKIININDIDKAMLGDINHFFEYYHSTEGVKVEVLGTGGIGDAEKMVRDYKL